MSKTKTIGLTLYTHHFVRYLFVGGSTFVIDLGLLYGFYKGAHTSVAIATTIGYWISIIYNFLLNRAWTFDARDKANLKRHIISYLMLLGFNYVFTLIFVSVFSKSLHLLLTKALAVLIQMTWTYVIYKKYIFVKHEILADETGGS
jgi:putative flippase GtrA